MHTLTHTQGQRLFFHLVLSDTWIGVGDGGVLEFTEEGYAKFVLELVTPNPDVEKRVPGKVYLKVCACVRGEPK